jgi:hypothetical protein
MAKSVIGNREKGNGQRELAVVSFQYGFTLVVFPLPLWERARVRG